MTTVETVEHWEVAGIPPGEHFQQWHFADFWEPGEVRARRFYRGHQDWQGLTLRRRVRTTTTTGWEEMT